MRTLTILLGTMLCFGLSGCIKNEPLNTEADIVKCILPPGILKSDPLITNNTVLLLILPGTAEIDHLAPEFELTPGATIKPKSGTVRDFTTPQTYTVTSEDGQWSKVYTVTVSQTDIPTVYDFEHWRTANKYETPYEVLEPGNEEMNIWASGNAGFAIAAGNAAQPDDFPTFSTTDAYQGKLAAQLVTRSTGKWGALAGMPIAAGNLFIGTFDGSSAMADPLGATHFGLPLGQKPVRFLGHYRYISGGNVTGKDGKEIIPVRRDIGQIYAILYETNDNVQYLDGSNITTSPNIVARAMFTGIKETEGTVYELFDVTFVYEKPYDPEKQKNFRYNLAVVFAASERGAYFEGAVGSTLYIDAVQVICE